MREHAPARPVLFICYIRAGFSFFKDTQTKNPGISAGVSITDYVRSD
jgi:hypothetical protein